MGRSYRIGAELVARWARSYKIGAELVARWARSYKIGAELVARWGALLQDRGEPSRRRPRR